MHRCPNRACPSRGREAVTNWVVGAGDVDALMNATQEELVEAEGIGPESAEAIAEWFRDEENRRLVAELRELGLRFVIGEDERPVEGRLTGQTYVITGTLEGFTREQA